MARIKAVVETYGKPFLFLEGGCSSRQGASLRPNDWNLVGAADAAANDDYCIYGKKAAEVVFRYYKGNVFIG